MSTRRGDRDATGEVTPEGVWTGEIHTAETARVDLGDATQRIDVAAATRPYDVAPTEILGVAEPEPTQALALDPTPVGGTPRAHLRRRVRRRPWRGRVLFALGAVLIAGVAYYGITLYQVHSTGQSDQARPVDAIVVMGAAQYDGRPSPQLQARLDHALALWNRGLAASVVVTGGKLPADRFTEAEASADYLVDRGVPADRIRSESESHNSYDALRGVAALLDDGATVLIVTDPFHSLRSRLTAEELGLDAYVSPTRTSPVQGNTARAREMKEAAGVAIGRIVGFRRLLGITG